jgi:endonuclease-3
LRKIDGATNFAVAYVTQVALGGHAIPVDAGALGALEVVGLVEEKDVRAGVVPGLERAIPKSRGLDFASQLHQLGADFFANPYDPDLHKILLQINPDARNRLPKRRRKRAEAPASPAEAEAGPEKTKPKKKRSRGKAKSTNQQPDEPGQAAPDKQGAKRQAPASSKQDPPAEDPGTPAAKKKSPADKKRSTRKKADADKAKSKARAGTKKSASEGLSRRKPR